MTEELQQADPFKEIRPYNDDEVPAAIERLIEDEEMQSAIARFRYPKLSRYFGWLLKPLIRAALRVRWGKVKTVREVQMEVAHFMEQMISGTTQGVTYSGLEQLSSEKGYLFISNHRDIALDSAFVNWGLYKCGLETVRIAIGDNLLRKPCATELMKLNKSFIVKRSAKGPRELMKALSELSSYIADSLTSGHSIWIAQKEGRAKDGDDKTDPAMVLIKSAKYNRGGLSRNLGTSLSHPLFGNKPRKQGADHLPSTQYSFEILEPEAFNKLKFTALHHAGNATLQSASDIHIHDLINQVAVDGNPLNLYDHTQVSVMGLKHN